MSVPGKFFTTALAPMVHGRIQTPIKLLMVFAMLWWCAGCSPNGSIVNGSWHYVWFGEVGVTLVRSVQIRGAIDIESDAYPGEIVKFKPTRINSNGHKAELYQGVVSKEGQFQATLNEGGWLNLLMGGLEDHDPSGKFRADILFINENNDQIWLPGHFEKLKDDRSHLP